MRRAYLLSDEEVQQLQSRFPMSDRDRKAIHAMEERARLQIVRGIEILEREKVKRELLRKYFKAVAYVSYLKDILERADTNAT